MSTVDFRAELAKAGADVDSRWSALRFFARRYPLGAAGALIMALFVFAAIFAPLITVYDPLSTNAALSLARPSWAHWLGCDFMGRDVYSRIVYGARISLAVGIGATMLGGSIGVLIGLSSGYFGGWADLAAQRLIDILQSLPLIVLATAQLGATILIEATLSFLGLGVPEPHPSWGRMLSESAAEYVRTAPWLVIFPGLAISAVVFGTNLLGDAVRDVLDPRQRS